MNEIDVYKRADLNGNVVVGKYCRKCNIFKSLNDYPLRKKGGYRRGECRECYRDYERSKSNRYYQKNKQTKKGD